MARAGESPLALVGALLIGALGVLGCLGLDPSKDTVDWLVGLHGCLALSTWWYWHFSYWGTSGWESFGAAALGVAVLFRITAIIDVTGYGHRLNTWPSAVSSEGFERYIITGEVASWGGLLVVVLAWRVALRWDFERAALALRKTDSCVEAHSLWLIAAVVAAASALFGVKGSAGGLILPTFFLLGVSAVPFLSPVHGSVGVRRAVMATVFGLPFAFLGLKSGSKEEIFLPLVPACYFAWMASRRFVSRAALIALAAGLLVLSQGYIQYVRLTTLSGGINIPVKELMRGYFDRNRDSKLDFLAASLESLSARINLTNSHAATMAVVDQQGTFSDEVFAPIPWTFIPRIIWPDKPVIQPGAQHTARLYGGQVSEQVTSTASGFFTGMFLGGELAGLLLGAIAYGYLLGSLQRRVARHASTAALGTYNLVMLQRAIRLDEMHAVYAFTGAVAFFVIHQFALSAISIVLSRKRSDAVLPSQQWQSTPKVEGRVEPIA